MKVAYGVLRQNHWLELDGTSQLVVDKCCFFAMKTLLKMQMNLSKL